MQTKNWYILYTYSKCEKKVAQQIQRLGIDYYLPTTIEERKWSDRIKRVEVPLFPNYLFVHTTLSYIDPIKEIKGVFRFVSFDKKLATIKQEEISQLQNLLKSKVRLSVTSQRFEVGQVVSIERGKLAGMQGTFVRFQGKNHLVVEFKMLKQSILIEVPKNSLSKVA